MSNLHTDLLALRARLTALRAAHAAEINTTVHTIYGVTGRPAAFRLDRGIEGLEDALDDCIDTYQGAHGLGDHAPEAGRSYEDQHRQTLADVL